MAYLDEQTGRIREGIAILRKGGDVFVDTAGGASGNSGGSFRAAFATMTAALAVVEDHGTIYVVGDVREQLLSPLGVQGVRIISAAGGRTRHDDGARWRDPASAVASTPLFTIREQGWELHNILFVPPASQTAVRLRRAEDATYPDGSHAVIKGCKFIGNDATPQGVGIESHGGSHHDLIEDCEFMGLVDAIKHTTGAGIASPLRWEIRRSWFATNTNHITLPANQSQIEQNKFDPATVVINTSGGTEGKNYVVDNHFSDAEADIDNAHGYTGHAADVWRNFSANIAAMYVGVPGA